ncbi:S41 family peptidase [Pseudooceanicola sp. LIPI14-2-Ac024]|uniref:S41 family peptidase n=1 Tax=Pseudooceanicola sp. LIPI14-2-Ac024 TaxID=3344875 RepID=UPI0035D12BAE
MPITRHRPFLARLLALAALASLGAGPAAHAQADGAAPDAGPYWIRGAQVSPDGQSIAFAYRGQIWIVPSAGGEAIPLTERQFRSNAPQWSPDSRMIAFASDRFNISDVFVMPVDGGEIRRLTEHSGAEAPLAFTADGTEVLITATVAGDAKADYIDGLGQHIGVVMRVPVEGGRARLVMSLPTVQADVSPDGRTMAYVDRKSAESLWRKGEISDGTPDVWLFDFETGAHTKVTDYRGVDRSPSFSGDGTMLYWTTEMPEAGITDPDAAPQTFNVWRRAIDGSTPPEQVTAHDGLPVRFASVADDGTLVYTYDTELWRLDPDAAEPVKVPVTIRQGTLYDGEVYADLADEISDAAVSPDGSEIALVARGDIFVVSPASGEVRRITDTPQAERSVSFAPDGRKLLYAAEREGDWDIYETALVREGDTSFLKAIELAESVAIDTETDALQPAYSPDGTRIAYRDDRNAIRVLDIASGETTEVLPDDATYFYGENDFDFEWAPDGRHIVTTTGFISTNTEVEMVETDGEHTRHNISNSGFGDTWGGFSPDGSIVYWATDRFSQRNLSLEPGMQDVMVAYLTPEGFMRRELGDAAVRPTVQPAGDTGTEAAPTDAAATGAAVADDAAEESEAEAPVPLDFDGLAYRTARVTGAPIIPVLARITDDNKAMFLVSFLPANGVLKADMIDLSTGQPRQVFVKSPAGLSDIQLTPDGTRAYLIYKNAIETVNLANGAGAPVPFTLSATFNPVEEMKYIFDHHWRFVQSKFYDSEMHGVDWPAVREVYARYLPHISHWEDFVQLMDEMLGELNASHLTPRFKWANPGWDQTAELGIIPDTLHEGPGVRIAAVLPGGPAALVGDPLTEGAVILAVDGDEIAADAEIHPLLNRKAGRILRLTVQPAGEGAPVDVPVRAAPPGTDGELAYHRWVDRRRAMVDEMSGGRLGYTHVRKMEDDAFRQVYSDLMGRARDKEGAIVDTRFNLGGNLHDQLTSFLTGTRHSGLVTRNGVDMGTTPYIRWAKPTALLMNTFNYSDASVFPYYYKREALGPTVGDRVPGTGTAVLRPDQLDKRVELGVPQIGFRTVEGDFFENREIVPDEIVRTPPAAIEAGEDPQLKAAVEALLRQIDG